jgi:hypothetical protein
MIGAAMSRRAGLGVAAALVLTLTAGTGCAGPVARHAPEQGHPGAQVAAAEPEPATVSLPRVRGGLPWPVALHTGDGVYVIGRSGAIHSLRPAASHARAQVHHPAGFVWVDRFAGSWAVMRGGHLVIGRDRAVIWRSAARYLVQDAAHMNQILTGRPGVAFEVRESGPWFMAGWHGPVHRVAAAGWPEMWTRSGNLIAVLHRPGSRSFGYAVFSPAGARLATLATGLTVSQVDQSNDDLATGTFWYLTPSGYLARTDGVTTGSSLTPAPSASRRCPVSGSSLGDWSSSCRPAGGKGRSFSTPMAACSRRSRHPRARWLALGRCLSARAAGWLPTS